MTKNQTSSHRARRVVNAAWNVTAAALRVGVRRLSTLWPRRHDHWVFGSRGDLFTDNPMYFFEYVRQAFPEIRAVWITGDRELAHRLRATGRRAYSRSSVAGIRELLQAKVNVYASDPADTGFALTGGAINVNVYHGLPIKQIEFDIDGGPARRAYHPATLPDRLRTHTLYAPKWEFQDVLATSSEWAEQQFRRSYQDRVGVVVRGCSPRMCAAFEGDSLPADLFPAETEVAKTIRRQTGRSLLFAPTWRRYEWNASDVLGSLDALENSLRASDTTLFVKSHLFSESAVGTGDRVVALPDRLDVTAILPLVDGLITDYSSIGLDAALLGKPVIWAPLDRAEYQRLESPRFDLDYDALIEGHHVSSPTELHAVISNAGWEDWTIPPDMLDLIWGPDAEATVIEGNSRLVEAVLRLTDSGDGTAADR